MTTYPLSEPATIYAAEGPANATSVKVGQGKLEECVDIVANMSSDEQEIVYIQMDDMELKFGPKDIGELLTYLREESSGLTNKEISDIETL